MNGEWAPRPCEGDYLYDPTRRQDSAVFTVIMNALARRLKGARGFLIASRVCAMLASPVIAADAGAGATTHFWQPFGCFHKTFAGHATLHVDGLIVRLIRLSSTSVGGNDAGNTRGFTGGAACPDGPQVLAWRVRRYRRHFDDGLA